MGDDMYLYILYFSQGARHLREEYGHVDDMPSLYNMTFKN